MFSVARQARTLFSALSVASVAPARQISYLRARPLLQPTILARGPVSVRFFSDGNAPSPTVFISGLPFTTSETEVLEAIAGLEPTRVVISSDGSGRSMGWAHVHFSSVEQAQTFIDSVSNHDISFGDRFQRAEFARHKTPLRGAERTRNPPSDTLFVGNLPYAADEVDVREALEPYGALKRVSVAYDFNKVSRGFAHVSFVNAADATAAMENEDLVIMGRRPRIDYAPVKPVINHPPSHKCFFSNFIGEESELHRALGEELAQKVVSIYFLKDKYTNQPTGSGFVDFKSVDDATTALEHTNGTLNLRYATPLRKNNPNASPKSSYGSDWGR